jgi:hypothetical protein
MKQNTTPVDMASEPVMARPMTSYNDVMGYLHSIRISEEVKRSVAQRLMVEVTGKNLSKAFARLDHLSQLQDDWDGYGAEKISYQVVSNLRQVLLISDDKDWENWMISPAPNGTLGLQSKLNAASISMGDEEYSYYSCRDGREDWGDFVPFSPSGFLEVMRRIV